MTSNATDLINPLLGLLILLLNVLKDFSSRNTVKNLTRDFLSENISRRGTLSLAYS